MSMRALCVAGRNRLRAALRLDDSTCRVTPDGKPPAFTGQLFAAVVPGQTVKAGDTDGGLDEYCSLTVVLTARAAYAPQDRQGEEVWLKAVEGLEASAEKARAYLHMSYALLDEANALIGAGHNGFIEPLQFRSLSAPRLVYADWFGAESRHKSGAASGVVCELSLDRARRIQVTGPELS